MGNSLKPQNKTQDVSLSEKANIAWSTIFALVAVIILAGNSLTVAAFTTRRLVRRRTHFFLISLAVADLMVGALVIPLYIYLSIQTDLPKGAVHHVFEAADILAGLASVFTLAMISAERLVAVGWPLVHRMFRKRSYFNFIGLAWLFALAISVINLLYRYKIVPYFATLDIVLTALLTSIVFTCTAYIALWIKVRFRDYGGFLGREHDKKLVKTLFLVTGVFVLTWTPFQALLFVVHFCRTCPFPPQNVVNFVKLLHFCNSFMNPIIYSLRIPEFLIAISDIFNCRYNPHNSEITLRTLRGETLDTMTGILSSYSSLNVRFCMGTENMVTSELNSSTFRQKFFKRTSSRMNSSRRTHVTTSPVWLQLQQLVPGQPWVGYLEVEWEWTQVGRVSFYTMGFLWERNYRLIDNYWIMFLHYPEWSSSWLTIHSGYHKDRI